MYVFITGEQNEDVRHQCSDAELTYCKFQCLQINDKVMLKSDEQTLHVVHSDLKCHDTSNGHLGGD